MNIGIVGSRGITDRNVVENAIVHSPFTPDAEVDRWNIAIVSGGADGVDTCAGLIADDWNLDINVIKPDYDDWSGEHPAKARNTQIVKESDAVVAVWDGESNGTRDTIDKALDRGVPLYVEVE